MSLAVGKGLPGPEGEREGEGELEERGGQQGSFCHRTALAILGVNERCESGSVGRGVPGTSSSMS